MIRNTRAINALRHVATAGLMLFPMLAFAAYNDVSLGTSAIINMDGIDISVSGTSDVVESITVNASNLSVTILPSSTVTFTSADKYILSPDVSYTGYVTTTCTASGSTLTLAADPAVPTKTITVTKSSLCDAAPATTSSNAGGGGGGGGGGSSYGVVDSVTKPAATVSTQATAQTTTTTPTPSASAVTATVYTRYLSMGSKGSDVTALQTLLEGKGFLTMPAGVAKGYFGQVTKKALQAYQESVGISPLGVVGPSTRAMLNKGESSAANASPVAAPSANSAVTYSRPLSLGSKGGDVTALQTLLEGKGFLTMPAGVAKGYFGQVTKKALQAYQESVGIDPLGNVGPATRKHLNSITE